MTIAISPLWTHFHIATQHWPEQKLYKLWLPAWVQVFGFEREGKESSLSMLTIQILHWQFKYYRAIPTEKIPMENNPIGKVAAFWGISRHGAVKSFTLLNCTERYHTYCNYSSTVFRAKLFPSGVLEHFRSTWVVLRLTETTTCQGIRFMILFIFDFYQSSKHTVLAEYSDEKFW